MASPLRWPLNCLAQFVFERRIAGVGSEQPLVVALEVGLAPLQSPGHSTLRSNFRLSHSVRCYIQVIIHLQPQPELRRCAITCQPQCRIGSDATLAQHDFIDATGWYTPARSPRSFSKRLAGGARKSFSVMARFSIRSLRIFSIFGGKGAHGHSEHTPVE